jgi:cysteine desulfurase/selenocysteine lyase
VALLCAGAILEWSAMGDHKRLYLDNAATSFPKPAAVHEAMLHFATQLGASPGRGAYSEAREAGQLMLQCRQRICRLIGAEPEKPEQLIFTLNTTDSLNLGIRGILQPHCKGGSKQAPHVITTSMDHNSVLRPFNYLVEQWGIDQTRVACDPNSGLVDPQDIRKAITPSTKLIAVIHGSNVSGTVQPIRQIGQIAREHDIPFLVDAAQTLGHMPVDVEADFIDLLAFPGHKGLLGPLGTGGLYIRPGIEKRMATVREGGTGSVSEDDTQPQFLPDRFEPGSHNAIGIIGLSEGVAWILDRGIDAIWSHERKMIGMMLESLTDQEICPGLSLYGPQTVDDRCGVFSIRIQGFNQPQALSDQLEAQFGILTRSVIHCAPLAHGNFGTHDLGGTTRLSFGPFNTSQDVGLATDALGQICRHHAEAVA